MLVCSMENSVVQEIGECRGCLQRMLQSLVGLFMTEKHCHMPVGRYIALVTLLDLMHISPVSLGLEIGSTDTGE